MDEDQLNTFKISFLKHSLVISCVLAAIFLVLKFGLGVDYVPTSSVLIILFFLILSNALFHLQLKVVDERIIRFVNRFMIITALKLFLFLFIILIYGFIDRKGLLVFALVFLLVYFTFSIFEVIQVLRIQKLMKK